MPNAAETILRDMIGDQALVIAKVKAAYQALADENAALRLELANLKTERVKTSLWKPGYEPRGVRGLSVTGIYPYAPES